MHHNIVFVFSQDNHILFRYLNSSQENKNTSYVLTVACTKFHRGSLFYRTNKNVEKYVLVLVRGTRRRLIVTIALLEIYRKRLINYICVGACYG